jgi:hypothetical protein
MNPLHDAFPTSCEISRSPQLAVTGLLHEALHAAQLALRSVHPDLSNPSLSIGSPRLPSVELAHLILHHSTRLADLLARYRSTLDEEWRRPWTFSHPLPRAHSQPQNQPD